MYSLVGLPTSIVILLLQQGRELQELVTVYCEIKGEYNKHPGNTTELSGVAAHLLSSKGGWVALVASLTVPIYAFLFRALSTLSSVSLRTKH